MWLWGSEDLGPPGKEGRSSFASPARMAAVPWKVEGYPGRKKTGHMTTHVAKMTDMAMLGPSSSGPKSGMFRFCVGGRRGWRGYSSLDMQFRFDVPRMLRRILPVLLWLDTMLGLVLWIDARTAVPGHPLVFHRLVSCSSILPLVSVEAHFRFRSWQPCLGLSGHLVAIRRQGDLSSLAVVCLGTRESKDLLTAFQSNIYLRFQAGLKT